MPLVAFLLVVVQASAADPIKIRWHGQSMFEVETPKGTRIVFDPHVIPAYGMKKLAHIQTTATCAVGQYSHVRSAYGCEEMVGNVSEWTHPVGKKATVGAFPEESAVPKPVLAGGQLVVVRGACFLRQSVNALRADHRRNLSMTRRNHWVGFRPACLLPIRPA